jgi:tetratricopeptide (TPR) repeat protein
LGVAGPIRAVRGRETQLLTDAHRARKRGQERAAIRLYKRILIESPRNLDVALRVAPMLAWSGQGFEAWQLYRRAAREFARRKQYHECLAVYRDACRFVPQEFEAWRLCAELQIKLKRPEGAFETLIEGRLHFGTPQTRGQAIALLARAREIVPWDETLLLDLAQLYARNDQPDMALELLSMLSCRVQGGMLRRVRLLQLGITWSPRYLLLWARALGRNGVIDPLPTPTRSDANPQPDLPVDQSPDHPPDPLPDQSPDQSPDRLPGHLADRSLDPSSDAPLDASFDERLEAAEPEAHAREATEPAGPPRLREVHDVREVGT